MKEMLKMSAASGGVCAKMKSKIDFITLFQGSRITIIITKCIENHSDLLRSGNSYSVLLGFIVWPRKIYEHGY